MRATTSPEETTCSKMVLPRLLQVWYGCHLCAWRKAGRSIDVDQSLSGLRCRPPSTKVGETRRAALSGLGPLFRQIRPETVQIQRRRANRRVARRPIVLSVASPASIVGLKGAAPCPVLTLVVSLIVCICDLIPWNSSYLSPAERCIGCHADVLYLDLRIALLLVLTQTCCAVEGSVVRMVFHFIVGSLLTGSWPPGSPSPLST
jgi:hypothetical protein